MYVTLAGFTTTLTKNISWKTCYLPIEISKHELLRKELGDGDHTFFELKDGNAIEIIKIVNICDKIAILRGQEGTRPQAFPCGTSVSYVSTEQGVKDMVCQMEDCDD